jgi:NADH:ubiquinone oxidoreductase subunit 2 (subunit N)
MFLIFTPYTFIFVSLYLILLFFIFNIRNFHIFWLFIEIRILLFIGICYTLFTNRYTQLIIYFLFQTLGSFSILVFFMLNYSWLAVFRVFLKLGIFPFFSWYLNAIFRFPSFVVFLATTIHKLPPLFIFFTLANRNLLQFTFFFALFTIVIAGVFIITVVDLRYLVIVSSIGNNSFLLLAVLTNSIFTFLVFFIIYSINMFLILSLFNNQTTVIYSIQLSKLSVIWLIILLFNIAAIPPLPGFFTKFLIFFDLLPIIESFLFFFVLVMLANILMIVSYIQLFFKFIVNNYSNSCNFILN